MRECPACGASNEATDDFCGNCGGYLGWSDRSGPRSVRSGGSAFEPDGLPDPAEPAAPGTDRAADTDSHDSDPSSGTRSRSPDQDPGGGTHGPDPETGAHRSDPAPDAGAHRSDPA
ncbi:zinc ribbon domain-containing protein, partial [Streptomyces sp. SID486]|uniref:zinc ribbon domain-containing protein n=1 Tax=Streptomyces sp. SID486 TaxID=2690264 RepID=UPI00235158B9